MLSFRRVFEAERPLIQNTEPIRAKGTGRKRCDLLRQLLCLRESATWLDYPGYQADPQRFVGRHRPAGEDLARRPAVADHPRQSNRAEVDERLSEAPIEDSERRVFSGDSEVAPQR